MIVYTKRLIEFDGRRAVNEEVVSQQGIQERLEDQARERKVDLFSCF